LLIVSRRVDKMKYLILSVVILAAIYSTQAAKTVAECGEAAKRCKTYMGSMARNNTSKEVIMRTIRTTPLSDICSGANGFLTCNKQILDDSECNIHEAVSKYQPLYTRISKVVEFICIKEKDAVQRAIPCITSRQFFGKISKCKKTYACNSNDSWDCALNSVASSCDAATKTWFQSYIPLFKANHPGCGNDNLFRQFHGAMTRRS